MGRSTALSIAISFLLLLVVHSEPSWAGPLDFRLNARNSDGTGVLFDCQTPLAVGCASFAPDNSQFENLVGQLAFALAPRMSSSAATLGHGGFRLAASWSGTFVDSAAPHWGVTERAQNTGHGPGLLQTLQIELRKGLPLSFEIAGQLQWLVDSEIWAPSFEVRWALEKTDVLWPDLTARVGISHLIGQRELNLTTAVAEVGVSKRFGLWSRIQITPYLGWGVLLTNASSSIVDPTPGTLVGAPGRPDVENDFVFDPIDLSDLIQHRISAGVETTYERFSLGLRGEFRVIGSTDAVHGMTIQAGFTI